MRRTERCLAFSWARLKANARGCSRPSTWTPRTRSRPHSSLPTWRTLAAAGSPGSRGLNYSASGSYLALSSDVALLEEYLRSTETQAKALRETVGLNEAAQKVGGMSTGFFGYENNSETMRVAFEALKRNPDGLGKNFSPLASVSGDKMNPKQLKEWFDFTLLPPFERVAKYF